jgi:hypothetical protein
MTAEQLARKIVELPGGTGRCLAAIYLLGTADMARLTAMLGLNERQVRNHLAILTSRALVTCQREKRQARLCIVDESTTVGPINPLMPPPLSADELVAQQLAAVKKLAGRADLEAPEPTDELDHLAAQILAVMHRHPVLAAAWRLEHSQAILRMNKDKADTIVFEAERFVDYLARSADRAQAPGKKRGAAKWLSDPATNWVHNFHNHLNPRGRGHGPRQGQLPQLDLTGKRAADKPSPETSFYNLPAAVIERYRKLAEADLRRLGLAVNPAAIDRRAMNLHAKEPPP